MKSSHLLLILIFVAAFAGCKKDNAGVSPKISLMGKWKLVADTTGFGASTIKLTTYVGQTADYFDFRANGKCYVKEGPRHDTLAFTLVTDTTFIMPGFGYSYDGTSPRIVSPLTAHVAVISSAGPVVPGLKTFRIVALKR